MTTAGGRASAALLLAAWSACIWWALTSTRVSAEPWFPGSRFVFNAGHGVLFAVEALLLGACLRPRERPGTSRAWFVAALVAWLYSAALEQVQAGIPGRSASAVDLVTNAVGAFGAPWALAARPLRPGRVALVAAAALASAAVDTLL